MNNPLTAWQLMVLTIKSLPVEFWRVVLTVIGAAFSLGNDTQSLFLKGRALFYGTVFGYLIADVIVTGFDLTGYSNLLFIAFGIGGNMLASIVLEAFKEAKANWRTILPFVWDYIKDNLPLKEYGNKIIDAIIARLNTKKS